MAHTVMAVNIKPYTHVHTDPPPPIQAITQSAVWCTDNDTPQNPNKLFPAVH